MKRLAVFGGTGFLGYDFLRLVLEGGAWDPVVYCTNPGSLTNVSRHELDVRVVPPARLESESLDDGIDIVVNFAHPFLPRDGLSAGEQIRQFAAFLERNRAHNPDLKLVHLSSLSVYEPFAPRREYVESDPLKPPWSDAYATCKAKAEHALRRLPGARDWQLILRPTVVYGPFCRPWTDALMRAFHGGDVPYVDLSGRIQPIFARDISRLIAARINEFRPGVLNLGGSEVMTWKDFFVFFEGIVGKGKLTEASGAAGGAAEPALGFYLRHLKALKRTIVNDSSFSAMAVRFATGLPRGFVTRVREFLRAGDAGAVASVARQPAPGPATYMRKFFSEDRLVSMERFQVEFPDFAFTPLSATRDVLRSYYEFRFTDRFFT